MSSEDIADKVITTTPRTLMLLAGLLLASYAGMFTTFATVQQVDVVAVNLTDHIDEQTIWKLETKLEDIGDKRWLVEQRMSQPGGDTQENRKQILDLEGREKKAVRSLNCVRNGGDHCISRTDG